MFFERRLRLIRSAAQTLGQQGLTMIELIVFIVIVSIALVAILRVLNVTAQHSADPIINKQLQAIAEAYMDEVSSMPFTYCDPADANVLTATTTANGSGVTFCASSALSENASPMGPKTVGGVLESRTKNPPFNNVMNYGPTFTSSPASDVTGTHQYTGYNVVVTVVNDANLGPAALLLPSAAVLRITVVVTSGTNSLTLEGYRTRYAPNATP